MPQPSTSQAPITPAGDSPARGDPAGLATHFTEPPQKLEHRLTYDWPDLIAEITVRAPKLPDEQCAVDILMQCGMDFQARISGASLTTRVTELLSGLSAKSADLSAFFRLIVHGNRSPKIATLLSKFDAVRPGTADDDASKVASISKPIFDTIEPPGDVLYFRSSDDFEICVPVKRLSDLPMIWKDIARRLEFQGV
jgi:hypothetical protein